MKNRDNSIEVLLGVCNNSLLCDMLLQCLEENGIAAYAKSEGSGSFMKLFMGYSIFESKVYVSQADLAQATEIWNTIIGENPIQIETPEN